MSSVEALAVGAGDRLFSLLDRSERRHPGRLRLSALCDESPAALERAAARIGRPVDTFGDLPEALEACAAPWVLVTSRNRLHRDHCLLALRAGRHVFCEKPLALSLEHCLEIRRAWHRSGTRFAAGLVLRHAPLYRRAKELVEQGTLGGLISFEANENLSPDHGAYIMRGWRRWRHEAGPHLLEKCCHDIDLLQWLVGSRPCRVASFGGLDLFTPENHELPQRLARPGEQPLPFFGWTSWENADPFTSDKDIVDNQLTLLEYANGARGVFATNTCSAFPQRRMILQGSEGSLELDLATGSLRVRRLGRDEDEIALRLPVPDLHGGGDDYFVDDLIRSMVEGLPPSVSLEPALEATVTCLAIDEALLSGKVVDLSSRWSAVDARAC